MATKTDQKPAGVVGGDASTQIKQFDNLRNILKNAKHSSGKDLYTHLVETMNHIVMHCPEQGLEKFEEISYLLKQQRDGKIESLSEFLKLSDERSYSKAGRDESTVKYLQKARKFFDVSKMMMRIDLLYHIFLNNPLKFFYCIRKKEVKPEKVESQLEMMQLLREVPQLHLADMFQTCLQTPECINGQVLVLETMKRSYWQSLLSCFQ